MHQLIACVIGGLVPFGGNATTAHIISADLSQIYVAASWVGTVTGIAAAAQPFGR